MSSLKICLQLERCLDRSGTDFETEPPPLLPPPPSPVRKGVVKRAVAVCLCWVCVRGGWKVGPTPVLEIGLHHTQLLIVQLIPCVSECVTHIAFSD